MTLAAFALVWIPSGGMLFLGALMLLAFFSALFLAPLNAWMQDRYPAQKRGELQAAANLQDCFAGILAVLLVTAFEAGAKALGVNALAGFHFQMIFVGLASGLATALIIRLLPAPFLRVIGVTLVRSIYRIRVLHEDRLPHQGGVLLLPNHVTYADAFFISAACPRPVRFVMDETFMRTRSIRAFTGIFDTMSIRRDHPLEAIRNIIQALHQGHVVCLFPEGQLTRTGTLCGLQRGFELIAKKVTHPLIPVWCDGSWGSIFSFERNRFFRKIPHRLEHGLTLAFGLPNSPSNASLESIRNAMLLTSAEAVGLRFLGNAWLSRLPRTKNPATAAFRVLPETTRKRIWVNGHQIAMVNALQRRQPFHVLRDDPVLTELPGLFAAFPDLFRATVRIHPSFPDNAPGTWVGGEVLRAALQAAPILSLIHI